MLVETKKLHFKTLEWELFLIIAVEIGSSHDDFSEDKTQRLELDSYDFI